MIVYTLPMLQKVHPHPPTNTCQKNVSLDVKDDENDVNEFFWCKADICYKQKHYFLLSYL